MVGNFCNRTACRIRNRRRRHDHNMTLRKKKTPRASQHYLGWRAGQKSLLFPVAGEFFLLTLPFIERGYWTTEIYLGITYPVPPFSETSRHVILGKQLRAFLNRAPRSTSVPLRTRLWPASGRGCRGQRLSRG
jgi:hypothetical protein